MSQATLVGKLKAQLLQVASVLPKLYKFLFPNFPFTAVTEVIGYITSSANCSQKMNIQSATEYNIKCLSCDVHQYNMQVLVDNYALPACCLNNM